MSDYSRLHFAHFEVARHEDGKPEELGRGAMGVTYKARDPELRVDVALKVINPAQVGDETARALFLREARAAARVHHANVGSVVFLSSDPQNTFYAMEFVAGQSLRDWLHSRVPLSPEMGVALSLQIARGLEAIHREGIIHRDLKPGNVMMVRADKQKAEDSPDGWQIKIIDFGLARAVEANDASETSAAANTNGFRGTALYASPEQCEERRDLDGRTDLYALGCMMWEMLVGTPPFRANVHRELLNAHVAKPLPLGQIGHLPAALQSIIVRLLEKDRDARFADAAELIRALERAQASVAVGAAGMPAQPMHSVESSMAATTALPTGTPPSGRMGPVPPGRSRAFLVTGFALLLAGAGFVAWRAGWLGRGVGGKEPVAQWNAPLMAILPATPANRDPADLKFADEVTDELLSRVAKLPGARVIPRGALTAYRSGEQAGARKRVQAIDAELGGVSAVLETSIDRKDNEVKINAALFDAKTERRLWGQTYRRDWRDAVTVEKEVPEQITRALRTVLSAAKRIPPSPTDRDPTATDLYFEAMPMSPFDERRMEKMEQVVRKDPGFAEALAESTIFGINRLGPPDPKKPEREEARRALEAKNRRALELDAECVPAMVFLSRLLEGPDKAEEKKAWTDRALAIAPNDFMANFFLGMRLQNQSDELAYAYVRRAQSTSTDSPRRGTLLLYFKAMQYALPDLAERWLTEIIAATNDLQTRELLMSARLLARGEYGAALDRLRTIPPDLATREFFASQLIFDALKGAKRYDEALAQLDRMKEFPDDGEMDPGHVDQQRAELLSRLGRIDEAKEAAKRVLSLYDEAARHQRVTSDMEPLRRAAALEILGRQDEAVAQLDRFVGLRMNPEPFQDPWIFRNNAAALERLEKLRQHGEQVKNRILEIERNFDEPPPVTRSK